MSCSYERSRASRTEMVSNAKERVLVGASTLSRRQILALGSRRDVSSDERDVEYVLVGEGQWPPSRGSPKTSSRR